MQRAGPDEGSLKFISYEHPSSAQNPEQVFQTPEKDMGALSISGDNSHPCSSLAPCLRCNLKSDFDLAKTSDISFAKSG